MAEPPHSLRRRKVYLVPADAFVAFLARGTRAFKVYDNGLPEESTILSADLSLDFAYVRLVVHSPSFPPALIGSEDEMNVIRPIERIDGAETEG